MNTLQYLIAERAEISPQHEALVEHNERYTFNEFHEKVNQLSHYFLEKGIQKGDRIGILAHTSIAYPVVTMGILQVGAVVVPLSKSMTPYELDSIITSGQLKAIIHHNEFTSVLEKAEQTDGLSFTLKIEDAKEFTTQFSGYNTNTPEALPKVLPEDLALMMFTSGTTGKSKGCMIAHGSVSAFLNSGGQEERANIDKSMRYLFVHPFFHMSSMSILFMCINTGNTMVCSEETDPAKVIEVIEKENIKMLFALPPALKYIVEELEKGDHYDFPLKLAVSGGTKVSESLIEQYDRNGMILAQGYGSTEAWIISSWHPQMGWKKVSSAGKPAPYVEVKIVDPDTRQEVPTGEKGEVLVRSPYLFKGYWQNEEATNGVLQDGWLAMGDAGRLDEDGFLYIEGRYKDVIVYGGDNIYPDQVEEVVLAADCVLEATVVGMPDDVYGEVPYAFVVKQEASALTEEDVVNFCKERLAPYKVPTVVFVSSLPKNSVGKVLKNEVKKQALAHA
ncbi:class I adenylate-forming enzyme family protein [Priestia megaterium]|uniref:class I adenylate-forming enzyme family protein n=1 Tax=Priestia megaterium TaxID=1404 RepID=UPI0035BE44C4